MVNPKDKTAPAAPDQAQGQGGDHVESLGDIAKQGLELEAGLAAPGAPGAPAAKDQKAVRDAAAAEIAAAMALLRASAIPFAPPHLHDPLGMLWNDKQLEQIAAAIVDICVLQGWELDDFFTRYGPYIQLAMALGIPLAATIKMLKMPAPGQQPADQPAQPAPAHGQQQQAQP